MIIFRLYFARENTYCKKYEYALLTDVYNTIEVLSNEYDEYLIITHNTISNQDDVFEYKRIEHKIKSKRK